MRKSTIGSRWLALATAYGGVAGLAERCGVTPMTVWRWGRLGVTPNGSAKKLIAGLCKARHLDNPLT